MKPIVGSFCAGLVLVAVLACPSTLAAQWSEWEGLGGTILEAPECVSWGPGRLDCFARSTDAAMWHRWFDGSNWWGWESLGGIILESPNCISRAPGRIDCFARDVNRALVHRWFDGSNWWGWENLGGTILEAPECVSWGPERLDCFARSTDAAMWHRGFDGNIWGAWESLGGTILESPECVSAGPSRLDCFARSTDAGMWHRSFDGSIFAPWESLGGVILEPPNCVSWGPYRLDCFARGTDRAMWHRAWSCPECAPYIVHPLQVRVHVTTTLSGLQADRITADASTALQRSDGPGDVGCPVQLMRTGTVTGFSFPDGSIDSRSEFEAVMAVPGQVKVVNAITWCGTMEPRLGCAPTPGSSFAVVRTTPSLEGLLWAHEFGHNKDLGHRNNDPNAIMNGTIGPTRRRINASECAAFLSTPFTAAVEGESLMSNAVPRGLPDVREFVRQVFIHGVPYEVAHRYPATVVPILVEMLRQPGEEEAWPNIVVTLGMIGDDQAVQPLIDFIEAGGSARLSQPHYMARTSAVMSLGYIIHHTGTRLALDYLKAGLEPSAWEARLGPGVAPFQASESERNRDFSKYALLGLALSGQPEAAQALRDLQRPAGRSPSEFAVEMDQLISEALGEHASIAAKGLEGYYRDARP